MVRFFSNVLVSDTSEQCLVGFCKGCVFYWNFGPWSTLLENGRPRSTMVDHGRPWSTMVDHRRPWSTMVDIGSYDHMIIGSYDHRII